jgi:hypothetical protein
LLALQANGPVLDLWGRKTGKLDEKEGQGSAKTEDVCEMV